VVKIKAFCTDVVAVANDPLTDVAAMAVPLVGQMQPASKNVCLTAEGLAAAAQSASTVPWLATAKTIMESKGAVLPPPMAPAPISPAS
jgi:hypothetical protein